MMMRITQSAAKMLSIVMRKTFFPVSAITILKILQSLKIFDGGLVGEE